MVSVALMTAAVMTGVMARVLRRAPALHRQCCSCGDQAPECPQCMLDRCAW